MKVKDYYSSISITLLYEWSLEKETPFNRRKRKHYAFFFSVKDIDTKTLSTDETIRLANIVELQHKQFKRR